jgi:phage terminase large subunit
VLTAQLPDWAEELFQPYRYKVMHGGRGSAKSWTVARVLLIEAARRPLRIGCFREVQDSIRDSVHRLLCDQIQAMGLGAHYTVTRDEIRHLNGSMFVFAGLAQHTVESIKSFEGLDRAWIEEGQVVSKRSWDVLTPTIRAPGSEIWVTMNPHLETDETYQRFIANPAPGSWIRRINWRDNPWFPTVLDDERRLCEKRDPDNYGNIWEGEPLRVAEGAIYRNEVDAMYVAGRVRPVPHDPILKVHTVWDLGWNDAMSIGLFQRSAAELRCIGYIEDSHHTVDWYVRELEKNKEYRWGFDFIPHDGRSRDHNSGKSTEDILKAMGRSVTVLPQLSVEEGIKAARMAFPRLYVDDTRCARFLECLKRYRRIVSKLGEAMGPLHDEYSHGADMWRYAAMSVDMMHNFEADQVRSYEPECFDD